MDISNRKIGLDVLKVLSMTGIIGLHLIGQGGVLNNLNVYDYRTFIILLVYVVCYLSVDIFAIISGYLCWKKKTIDYSRIVELIFVTFFYGVVLTLIFYIFNFYNFRAFGFTGIINSLFPAAIGMNWYITCYIFVFFLMPYLNFVINELEQIKFKKMLIIIFVMLSIIPNIFFQIDFFKAIDGYSPLWLLYCYFLGGYLGKYGLNIKLKNKIMIVVFCILSAYVCNLLCRIISFRIHGVVLHGSWFINYVSPFNIIASLLLVSLLSNIRIKNTFISKLIIFFSVSSFSVYIIHTHYLTYNYVLLNILKFSLMHNVLIILLYLTLFAFMIYMICSIIEFLRIVLFRIFKIDLIIKKIGSKFNDMLE